jgi:RNA polymerase sigma factor (sigma-70 family)
MSKLRNGDEAMLSGFQIATRRTLLARLDNVDDAGAWQDFFDIYWRLIHGVAIAAGLSEEDAQEVVQDTVLGVAHRIPGFVYDPSRCAFKTWLLTLTRSRVIDQLRRVKGPKGRMIRWDLSADEIDALADVADPRDSDLEAITDRQWREHVQSIAVQRVKRKVSAKQFQIFDLCVLKELPVRTVAQRLGISIGQVYLARHRVGRALRKEVQDLA